MYMVLMFGECRAGMGPGTCLMIQCEGSPGCGFIIGTGYHDKRYSPCRVVDIVFGRATVLSALAWAKQTASPYHHLSLGRVDPGM